MIVKGFAEHWQEQEQSVHSFRWTVEDFPTRMRDLVDKNEGPLTSGEWTTPNGHKWRAILTQDLKLFIQLVAAPFQLEWNSGRRTPYVMTNKRRLMNVA